MRRTTPQPDRVRHGFAGLTTYKIADSHAERIAAYRLVYRNYLRKRLILPNPHAMRVTPFHLLPTTTTLIGVQRGEVVSTVTLIGDGEFGIPMDTTNEDVVGELRGNGFSFGEVSCLAFNETESRRFLPMFIQLTRLMAQFARFHGMDQFLIATIPQHARFYKRFMGFKQVADEQPYPTVCNTTGVACCLDFNEIDRNRPACYDKFFGEAIPEARQTPRSMSEDEIAYFRPMTEFSVDLVPAMG
ncbi:MAG: hypothetical protein ACE5KM_03705 [Planctomycetaceae bacterium]